MADQFRAPYPIEDDDLGSLLTIDNLKSIRTDNQLPHEFNDVLQTDGLYEIIEEYLSPLSRDIDLQITAVADTNITAMCIGAIQECTSSNGVIYTDDIINLAFLADYRKISLAIIIDDCAPHKAQGTIFVAGDIKYKNMHLQIHGLKMCINPDEAYIDLDMNAIPLLYIQDTGDEWDEVESMQEMVEIISITYELRIALHADESWDDTPLEYVCL